MKTNFYTINDGYGIIGIGYECPKCGRAEQFVEVDEIEDGGCDQCGYKETFTDEQKDYIDNMW